MSVVIHYRTDCSEAVNRLTSYKDRVFYIQSDLRENPEEIVNKALEFPVKLTGLVNNTALFSEGNLSDPTHLESVLSLNTLIPVRISSRFAGSVDNGWIINITDAKINSLNKRFMNYRISKMLLEEITRQQAFLYAPRIRVNAIAPGIMIPAETTKNVDIDSLTEKIPLGAAGNMVSLMDAYSFLVRGGYITGEVIRVDGGWHLVP